MSEVTTRSTTRRRWARLGTVGLVLPLLAATVLVWSTTGREARLDKIPVAVVNNDVIIQKPQPMAAGRALASALTEPTSSDPNLDWTLSDTSDAEAGLRDGDYYAVLTIPPDFSRSVLSSGTSDPTQGRLQLASNGAASSTVPFISEAIASTAATSLGNQTTQGYLGQVYDGFNQIASSNQQAADSAAQLSSGADQLADGAASLDESADDLAASLSQLSDGAEELATAAGSVIDGTEEIASGASALAAGSRDLHQGVGALAGGSRRLAGRSGDLAGAANTLASGAARNAAAARTVARANRDLALEVAALDRLCDRVVRRHRLCTRLDQARVSTQRLAAASTEVGIGSTAVAFGAKAIAGGTSGLAGAAGRLAEGAGELDRASGTLADSAGTLSDGAGSVAQGARELGSASDSLAAGASAAADGGAELAAGSSRLSSSAVSVDQGSNQLSQGLAKGAAESPTYSKKQKQALETVVSEPVVLASATQHTQHGNGWLLALVLGLVLWLAALLGVVGRDVGLVLRHSRAPLSSVRLASLQLGPAAGLALLQAVAVIAALVLLQVGTASAVPLALLTVLAAATFTLLGVLLRWSLGGVGIAVFVLLLAVQGAALGNVLPLETAPGLLQTLNAVLPLTAYVNGASQLVSGGQVGSLTSVTMVLLGWSVAAALAAVVVVRRLRMARPLGT